jgi:hypothetical protein
MTAHRTRRWAMLLVTGAGGTDGFPSPESSAENLVITGMNLAAALFWTTVLALFCEMITNGSPELVDFQQTLDELEIFMNNCAWAGYTHRGSPHMPHVVRMLTHGLDSRVCR